MCNSCGCSNHGGNNSNSGCVNLLNELADAINNFFTNPCNRCSGNNNAQWRSGFQSGWQARGNSPSWRNGFESGWNARANSGCGCSQHNNSTVNLSNLTCCGNYDPYYARQYGLGGNGCSCSL